MAKIKLTTAEATREIAKLVKQVKALKTSNSTANKSVRSLTTRLNNLKSKVTASNSAIRSLNRQLKNQQKATRKLRSEVKNLTNSTNTNTTSINANTSATKKNTAASKSAKKSKTSLLGATKKLIAAFGLISGLQIFANIVKDAFSLIKTFDSLNFTLEAITTSTLDAANAESFLKDITVSYGVELVATTNRYLKFLAAAQQSGLALKDTEKIFRSMTKASSSLGLATHEMEGVFLALEQMLSKGKVTTEELRRQLGERLPGAMGIMAAAVGVTTSELDSMLRKGQVLSAEVLPKFADAVEIAYGIENVNKIDTLVASQNRATTAWQNFIKAISEGDSVIKKVLKGSLEIFEEFSNNLTFLFGGIDPKISEAISRAEKDTKKITERFATEAVNLRSKQNQKLININKRFKAKENEVLKEVDAEKRLLLQQELADILKEKIDFNKKVEEETKKSARNSYDVALAEYKAASDKFKQLNNDLKASQKVIDDVGIFSSKALKLQEAEARETRSNTKRELGEFVDEYARAVGRFNYFRKLLQESDVEKFTPTKPKGVGPVKKNLKPPKDLSGEIKIKILENNIRLNKKLIDSDKTYISEKKDLLLDISKFEESIYKIQFDDKVKIIESQYDYDLKALQDNLDKKQITEEEFYNQSVALYNEQAQKIKLAELENNKSIYSSKLKLSKNLLGIVADENKITIDKVKNKYDLEIIALNEVYENSKKTAKDFEALEKGKKEVAIKMANAIIDAQIKILQAQIAVKGQSKEFIEEITRAIEKLQASKSKLNPGTEDDKDGTLTWIDWAEKIGDIIGEVGNLIDALYDRRIENIEKEINAEEKKYDKLISLAKDDEAQQEALRQQKEDRLAVLEKKKLKEEQKQARLKKAFAISEIAINTAIAVSKVWGQTGIFGVAAQIPVLLMGALQIATVLAQPIPQYAEGLDKADKDHIGMINDGGQKEYIERDGKILSTDTKNAIVKLKKGDTIHKSYDEMVNKSALYSLLNNYDIKPYKDNEKLDIESAIENGFKNAKNIHNLNVIAKINNTQKSYWS